MLTKMTLGCNIATWDLYLPEALYATRIRQHASSGRSPFFLVYGLEPRILEDNPDLRPLDVEIDGCKERHQQVVSARTLAYEKLVQRAEQANLIDPEKYKDTHPSFLVGQWVLVRNESKTKLWPR